MRAIAMLSVMLLTGCATSSPAPIIVRPSLPPFPADLSPVSPVPPRAGVDAREYAARSVSALVEANSRLNRARLFYEDVVTSYGARKDGGASSQP